MKRAREYKVWAYVRDSNVPPGVVIAQMSRLLEDAERLGLSIVGMSQDIHSGDSLDRQGLKDALRAIRTGYANALLVRDVSRLSEDHHILLRIIETLQEYDAVLICTAEDAHASLQAKGLTGSLY